MLSQYALNEDLDFGAGAFTKGPIDSYAFANVRDQLCRDDFEIIFAHHLDGAVVCGERIIKRHFVIVKAEIGAALICGVHFLGELDQFFDDFLRSDRAGVICVQRLLQYLGKLAALDKVSL